MKASADVGQGGAYGLGLAGFVDAGSKDTLDVWTNSVFLLGADLQKDKPDLTRPILPTGDSDDLSQARGFGIRGPPCDDPPILFPTLKPGWQAKHQQKQGNLRGAEFNNLPPALRLAL